MYGGQSETQSSVCAYDKASSEPRRSSPSRNPRVREEGLHGFVLPQIDHRTDLRLYHRYTLIKVGLIKVETCKCYPGLRGMCCSNLRYCLSRGCRFALPSCSSLVDLLCDAPSHIWVCTNKCATKIGQFIARKLAAIHLHDFTLIVDCSMLAFCTSLHRASGLRIKQCYYFILCSNTSRMHGSNGDCVRGLG